MTTRTTRKDVDAAFDAFLKAHNLRRADNYADVGGYILDYASVYGGYVVARIVNDGGGQDTPFGSRRRTAKEMEATLRFAADVKWTLDYEAERASRTA